MPNIELVLRDLCLTLELFTLEAMTGDGFPDVLLDKFLIGFIGVAVIVALLLLVGCCGGAGGGSLLVGDVLEQCPK